MVMTIRREEMLEVTHPKHWKRSSEKDVLRGRQPHRKRISEEDDFTKKEPYRKLISEEKTSQITEQ